MKEKIVCKIFGHNLSFQTKSKFNPDLGEFLFCDHCGICMNIELEIAKSLDGAKQYYLKNKQDEQRNS